LINVDRKERNVMCVAVPGKIIEINGDLAKVDIMNNITQANIALVSAKIGDYVLIHAGCVLEVLKKDAAEEILDIFRELQEGADEDFSAGKG
jgi:hydrogenase expression/formation protein HypC